MTTAKNHKHRAATTTERCFSGPVASGTRENPAAHGNIRVAELCRCGAQRRTNVNGRHSETSGWVVSDDE